MVLFQVECLDTLIPAGPRALLSSTTRTQFPTNHEEPVNPSTRPVEHIYGVQGAQIDNNTAVVGTPALTAMAAASDRKWQIVVDSESNCDRDLLGGGDSYDICWCARAAIDCRRFQIAIISGPERDSAQGRRNDHTFSALKSCARCTGNA